jgi:hypothetical protein
MKTSTKILLAGIVPVLLFAATNLTVNNVRAERIRPQVKQLARELELKTVRVVDLRGEFTPEEIRHLKDGDFDWNNNHLTSVVRHKNAYFNTQAIPSADWLRRQGEVLIVDRPAGRLKIHLPNLEELQLNGETIHSWEPEKEEEKPEEDH